MFFDSYGLKWEYEPETLNIYGVNYLPDFRVHLPDGSAVWLEVKGAGGCDEQELIGPRRALAYVVFGPPQPFAVWHFAISGCGFDNHCMGWHSLGYCFCFNDRYDYRTWDMNNAAVMWEQNDKARWDYCGPLARKAIEATRRERFGAYE